MNLPKGSGRWVAIDTEGGPALHPDDGHRVSTVSVAWEADGKIVAKAFPFDQGIRDKIASAQGSLFDQADTNLGRKEWDQFWRWVTRQKLIMHNAAHDVAAIRAGTRQWRGPELTDALAWDTMLGEWILRPTEKIGLEVAGQRAFGEGKSKDELERALAALPRGYRKRYDMVPFESIEEYANQDVILTLKLQQRQMAQFAVESSDLGEVFDREMQVCKVLLGMCKRGIGYDVGSSITETAKAKKLLASLIKDLPFKATPDGARVWFYTTQKQLPHCMTDKGSPSVGECCVRVLVQNEVPYADTWAKIAKVKHAINTYYAGFVDKCGADGRLRTDFRQTGTVSMRFSSQRTNLQSLPHDYRLELVQGVTPVRALFRAAEGCELWEMDINQAELRTGAKIAKCKKMLRAFETGDDIHGMTATELFGVDVKSKEFFEYRQVAKRSNFSLIYDVGWVTFRATVDKYLGIKLSEQEAQRIVQRWRKIYPEFPFINRKVELVTRRRAEQNDGLGYVNLVTGRKRWFAPYEDWHKSFNQLVQGNIAEAVKVLMIEIDERWPGTLILQIHDSVVVEVPSPGGGVVDEITGLGGNILTGMLKVPMSMDKKLWVSA